MQPGSTAKHVILCLNSGSSSLKFALYLLGEAEEVRLARGAVERIGLSGGRLWIEGKDNDVLVDVNREFPDFSASAGSISAVARDLGLPTPVAAGHRVVHGGPRHSSSERVDAALLAELRRLIPFAPLHLPSAIKGIEAVKARFPGMPQVACFDTAFHRFIPEVAQRFPLSRDLWNQGVRRYGFHGLSYEYIVSILGPAAQGRVVMAHLGNGSSLAAVRNGQPLDTTMGFTPTGGLMMGTRSGDLDPGVLIHLMREKDYDSSQIDELVNNYAGLQGVSGISSDMRTLLEQRERDPRAAQAVEMFCYYLRKHIGAMAAVTGGLDTLVFTGGIGEHAAAVRWEVCAGLAFLGIRLDTDKNAQHAEVISTPDSSCTVRVIPTNEDLMIARHTRALLFSTVMYGRE
jgi:acetate kinase